MRIAYFPAGPRHFASSRLRVWKITDVLQAHGHTCIVNPDDAATKGCEIAVVQKRDDLNIRMQWWKKAGVRTVFDMDDWHARSTGADVVTIGSEALRELYPNGVFIPDALDIEDMSPRKTQYNRELKSVVWFGNPENLSHLHDCYEACFRQRIQLTVITDLRSKHFSPMYASASYVQWSLETVDSEIVKHDLAACPYTLAGLDATHSKEWVAAKGENRLFKAWALGLPVIGTPIRSYMEHGLEHWAECVTDWEKELQIMRSYDDRRIDVERGRKLAAEHHASKVSRLWLKVFKNEQPQ